MLRRTTMTWVALLAGATLLAGCPKEKGLDPAVASTMKQMEFINNQIEVFAAAENRAPYPEEGLPLVFDGQTPTDAWGNPIVYQAPGPQGLAFELISFGSDGATGGKGMAADLIWSEIQK